SMDWLNWNTAWWRGINYNCSKKKWRYTLWDCDATFHHYINYTSIPNTNANADPCDPESLNNPGGQGHVPILNALMTNPTFKQYYVMRYFDLLNSGLSCTRMVQILDSMTLKITPEMPRQITKWGGNMGQWQQNVLALKNFILQRCDSVLNGFNNCYNVTGPHKVVIKVMPVNSGLVTFNSLTLTAFPWTGNYPGTLPNLAKAIPNPNYCFTHWSANTSSITPNTSATSVSITLNAADTIIAHFAINQTLTPVPETATICSGKGVQLDVLDGFEYNWTPTVGLSCTTCSNPIASPIVSTVYTVGPSSCTSFKQITVTVIPSPTIQLTTATPTLCIGQTFTSQITATGAQTYTWSPTNTINFINPSMVIANPLVSTIYTVAGANISGTTTCIEQASISIIVAPQIVPVISPSVSICIGEKVNLTASGGSNYYWSPSEALNVTNLASVVSNPTSNIVYTVSIDKEGYCSNTATTAIIVNQFPKVNAGHDSTFNIDEQIFITANGTGTITWVAGEYISCKDCAQTQIQPKRDGCYVAEAVNEFGCKVKDEVCITVTNNWGLFIPNSFTPNGDGLNDKFLVYANSLLNYKIEIFDRWGKLLFTSDNIENSWDGTYKGQLCSLGVYTCKVNFKGVDGKDREKMGSISLIR
nr:gliding motility-associated C-terminal domain-containing protein [Bacteroidota bacterium]